MSAPHKKIRRERTNITLDPHVKADAIAVLKGPESLSTLAEDLLKKEIAARMRSWRGVRAAARVRSRKRQNNGPPRRLPGLYPLANTNPAPAPNLGSAVPSGATPTRGN